MFNFVVTTYYFSVARCVAVAVAVASTTHVQITIIAGIPE